MITGLNKLTELIKLDEQNHSSEIIDDTACDTAQKSA